MKLLERTKPRNKLCIGLRANGDFCKNKTNDITERCQECWDDLQENASDIQIQEIASLSVLPESMLNFIVKAAMVSSLLAVKVLTRDDLTLSHKKMFLKNMFEEKNIENIDYIWILQKENNIPEFFDLLALLTAKNIKKVSLENMKEISAQIQKRETWQQLQPKSQKIYEKIGSI